MKNSGRRQVRTPVANKTKRGAELEGTPKTPSSFEVSPCNFTCMGSFSQQPDDGRRLQIRSRRPLQWSISARQGNNAVATEVMAEDSLETTSCPCLEPASKSRGESKRVAALSPICVNAISGNAEQEERGSKATAMKKWKEMPPSLASPSVKDCNASSHRKGHAGGANVIEDTHWNASEDSDEELPGSLPTSPESQISLLPEKRVVFWSNAAFNQRPAHDETVCISKDTASLSSCPSSTLIPHHKIDITVRAHCEAESKTTYQDPLPEIDGGQSCNANGGQRETPIVDTTAGAQNEIGVLEFSEPVDEGTKPRSSRGEFAENSLRRKLVLENNKLASCTSILELDCGAFPYQLQQTSETEEHTDLQKCIRQANQATKNEEERLEVGMNEIEQEIQRLTERLTELQLVKRTREKEMRQHGEDINEKAEITSHIGRKGATERERSVVAMVQQRQCKKQSSMTEAKRGKGAVSISSNSAPVLRSSGAQSLRSLHEVVSKVKDESPLACISRRVQCPSSGNVGKLSELRRSVTSASRRKENRNQSSDAEAERSKVLRRLSMSRAMMSSPLNVQAKQQQQRSSTPGRVVSSRYGRAITPDACRLSGGSCKKRDQLSSATSSPLPQPPPSVMCSPLKKIATPRTGYPSRLGFATPTKERQQLKSIRAAAVYPSNTAAPSSLSSLSAQSRGCLLHSPSKPPITRSDSPKSTAALYKCLESLLEDSKHFFKHLSPARSHLRTHNDLPQQP